MLGFIKRFFLKREIKKFLKSVDGEHMNALRAFLGGSKKATAVFIALLTLLLKEALGLDDGTVKMIVQLVMTYLLGQGAVDVALVMKNKKDK